MAKWLSRMSFRRGHQQDLADIWLGESARTNCKSIGEGDIELRVCFRNLCDIPLVLCWVDHDGIPENFYRLDPCGIEGDFHEDDHIEYTFVGHAFIIARGDDIEGILKKESLDDDDGAIVVAGYRGKKEGPHLVEIHPGRETVMCCAGPRLRGSAISQMLSSSEVHLVVKMPDDAAKHSSTPKPFFRQHNQDLADIWLGESARINCKSIQAGSDELRICFRNLCDIPLVLCWVDHSGTPENFYRLDPCAIEGNVCKDDHVENSFVGHAFIIARGDDIEEIQKSESLDAATIVGGYRGKKDGLQLVEVHPGRERTTCCGGTPPPPPRLRGTVNAQLRGSAASSSTEFYLIVKPGVVDPTPLDTTKKKYISTTLGDWPVQLDADINPNDERLWHLSQDLEVLSTCLPPHAAEFLKKSTPLWVNDTFRYGPAALPIRATTCCFHPDSEWLKEMGCLEDKCECVEMYDLDDYNRTRGTWETGGVMLHEYSHAYHFKYLENGYENKEIKECYQAAMKQGLYDCVEVHELDGTSTAKAYACENQMEYFAELSAAFLGGCNGDEEFNKWYPFNRKQIKKHDPKAYDMLKKVWQVRDE